MKNLFINGRWVEGNGDIFISSNPSNGKVVWEGKAATNEDIGKAVHAASTAFHIWSELDFSKREEYLHKFSEILQSKKEELAKTISKEVGKLSWDALAEVHGVQTKVGFSIQAYFDRCKELKNANSVTRFKPHGVIAVFGAFNFPAHVAHGHIIPALLAGNTIIYKPSEQAPSTAELTVKIWEEAGLPAGVLNLVQGTRTTGEALSTHNDIDGIYFTGSSTVGIAISKANAEHPNKIISLEMGGNNPIIVYKVKDLTAAAYHTIQSAFISAGQRCTCARRLIVPTSDEGDRFISVLKKIIENIKVGPPDSEPVPYMGPVISPKIAQWLTQVQEEWITKGAKSIIKLKHLKPGTGLVSPGFIDVTSIKDRKDEEVFGPLLQLIRVEDFDSAIIEANNTKYGLTAALISDDPNLYKKFYKFSRAGVVNWNQQTTGASSAAPFGGTGFSGNHRPTAYFAADYCSYPVASIEYPAAKLPDKISPGLTLA